MPNNDNEINVLPTKRRGIQVNERYERAIRNDERKSGRKIEKRKKRGIRRLSLCARIGKEKYF